MREECSELLDTAVRPTFNIVNNEKGLVRILGNGLVHKIDARRADIHIRSSMQESDLNVIGDGTDPNEVEVEEVECGSRAPVKMPDHKRPSQE